jgi:hypothetical protein
MTIVTQSGDPTLWTSLYAEWENWSRPGWITRGGSHYLTVQKSNGDIEFHLQDNYEMLDSRSPTDSRAATYVNLDG